MSPSPILPQSIRFYSTLFAAEPAVTKPDYAKWMLDDPRVNFAISTRGGGGLDHLGIQVETPDELHEVYGRLQAGRPAGAGGRRHHLLLRQIGKVVDHRPARACLGNLPHLGRKHGLRRQRRSRPDQDDGRGLLHAETPQGACCAPKPELAADAACCAEGAAP